MEISFQLKAQLGKTLSDSINRNAKFRVEGCGAKEQNVPVKIVPYMQVMTPPQAH